jgi:hypothetical protein
MVNLKNPKKQVIVDPTHALYKWSKIFNRLQRQFFVDPVMKLRREKQIEDFVFLNGYQRPWILADTDVLSSLKPRQTENLQDADIAIMLDQKFSRYPCPVIIEKIIEIVEQCPALYLCLNRHYINIDNSYHDQELDDNFNRAITQWLQKNLPFEVLDLGLDYVDYGHAFTWAIPDRHYLIRRKGS